MKLQVIPPHKALNKAYLKQSVKRDQIETFKAALVRMFERLRPDESEEHLKNIVADFLKNAWYRDSNEINTNGRKDMVIHGGKSSKDPVAVIIEVKRPANKNEMVSPDRANVKALHELLHYYMQERYILGNKEIRHLIICNIDEWYIFDAVDFERFFFGNQKLVKSYKDWNDGFLVSANTDWFYQEIAKPFIEQELSEIPCTCFNLRDFEKIVRNPDKADDRKLINLYKLLSPSHLLKQPFANDSNSLNREFYSELLHIIGLEEVKEKGKKLIRRKPDGTRNDGTLLENTITILNRRASATNEDQLFSTALELCITWLNRLLFLKLLEGQLIAWHKGDRSRAFLTSSRIEDFDDLNELFFDVLAMRPGDRTESVRDSFGDIPYLNSSLFEESDLERATLRISELKNRLDLPLYQFTVLKDVGGKRLAGAKRTLHYLFDFLDAYDFAADGSAEIQEQNKTLINASVLGLIFEKINGYRDGSFYTPGFITMYICRETIRRAILRRFNERYGWPCTDFTELYNRIDPGKLREANEIVNGLKVCDPAVGSGHFLVSALNEIIAAKSDLGILIDKDGRRLRDYQVAIENDELIVTHDDRILEYNHRDPESQRVQETLFHEKETIIENCLFGVDINPKSVAICRLRLWIELLKNAYYRRGTDELETLPNIDINIKCGNSLISRFTIGGNPNILPADRKKLKELTETYRRHVFEYKLSPANKAQLRKNIEDLKHSLENFGLPSDRDLAMLRKKENEVAQLGFAFDKKGAAARKKLMEEVEVLRVRFDEKQRSVYHNAFEWRFEFPEVLDDNGEFVGFDVVIGNPPYVRADAGDEHLAMRKFIVESGQYETLWEKWDLYVPFMELGYKLLRPMGVEAMIVSDGYCHAKYAKKSQEWFLNNSTVSRIDFIGSLDIFEEASVHNVVCFFERRNGEANFPDRRLHEGAFGKVRLLPTDEQCNLSHRAFFPEESEPMGFAVPIVPLSEICYVSVGMVVHANEKESKGAFELRDLVIDESDERHPKPFVEGKHLARWLPVTNKWLEWGTERAPSLFRRPTFPDLYEVEEKLISVDMAAGVGQLKVAYDDTRLYHNHSAWSFVPWHNLEGIRNKSLQKAARYDDEKPRPDLPRRETLESTSRSFSAKYLLAVMNSSVARDFLRANRRSNIHLYPDDWKKLPVPNISSERQAETIAIVDRILAARSEDRVADVSSLETELDCLVSKLYGLVEEEINPVQATG